MTPRRMIMLAVCAVFAVTVAHVVIAANATPPVPVMQVNQQAPVAPAVVPSAGVSSHVRIPHPHHVPGSYLVRRIAWRTYRRNRN